MADKGIEATYKIFSIIPRYSSRNPKVSSVTIKGFVILRSDSQMKIDEALVSSISGNKSALSEQNNLILFEVDFNCIPIEIL